MQKESIHTENAPAAIGPYSQAVRAGQFVYTAGQGPLDPATGRRIEGDIAAQTERVLQNIQAILLAAGTNLDNVVKTTVFLQDIDDFAAMNEVYARYFGDNRPARTTIQAAALPLGIDVEIEAVAIVDNRQ